MNTKLKTILFVGILTSLSTTPAASGSCEQYMNKIKVFFGKIPNITYEPAPNIMPTAESDGMLSIKPDMVADSVRYIKRNPASIAAMIELDNNGVARLYYEQHIVPLNHALTSSESGLYNYVITLNDQIIIGKDKSDGVKSPHPCLIGGYADDIRVKGAGTLYIRNKRIVALDLASGHFKTPVEFKAQIERIFNRLPDYMRAGTLSVTKSVFEGNWR